jgi:hypothetical protein
MQPHQHAGFRVANGTGRYEPLIDRGIIESHDLLEGFIDFCVP